MERFHWLRMLGIAVASSGVAAASVFGAIFAFPAGVVALVALFALWRWHPLFPATVFVKLGAVVVQVGFMVAAMMDAGFAASWYLTPVYALHGAAAVLLGVAAMRLGDGHASARLALSCAVLYAAAGLAMPFAFPLGGPWVFIVARAVHGFAFAGLGAGIIWWSVQDAEPASTPLPALPPGVES